MDYSRLHRVVFLSTSTRLRHLRSFICSYGLDVLKPTRCCYDFSSKMFQLRIFTGGGSFQNTNHAELALFSPFSCKTVISTYWVITVQLHVHS